MIRLSRLKIENFRGIRNADVTFSDINFLVGNNGAGKTSCLAAIARLLPILRGEERIFLDGDFLFQGVEQAESIKLTYYFDLTLDSQAKKSIQLCVEGNRSEKGKGRSHLNDQETGTFTTSLLNAGEDSAHIEMLKQRAAFTQTIIRNGWSGGRICPISLQTDKRQNHAATHTQEESGAFDALRARLVQKLGKTELGKLVDEEHPELLKHVLDFTNEFLGELRFTGIQIGYSDTLNLSRVDGTVQSWEALSGGEQSAFNLAMAIEFSRSVQSRFLILEEPETNLHPSVQQNFLKIIEKCLPERQIFVSTHSPYIFENHLSSATLVIGTSTAKGTILENPSPQLWLFSTASWGELSFHAYGLATFEYHNELYGWLQERTASYDEKLLEVFLVQQGCVQDKLWVRTDKGKVGKNYDVTAMTYIRNFTHHPENTYNTKYTEEELRNSISKMLVIIRIIR